MGDAFVFEIELVGDRPERGVARVLNQLYEFVCMKGEVLGRRVQCEYLCACLPTARFLRWLVHLARTCMSLSANYFLGE